MRYVRLLARPARLAVAVVLACLPGLLAFGCASTTPTSKPATITFAHLEYDTDYFEKLAGIFHETYPHITVELRPVSEDRLDSLPPDAADVRVTWEGAIVRLLEQDALLSLDPFMQRDENAGPNLSDFYPGTVWDLDGKIWAIPCGLDPVVLYYNRQLVDEQGVPPPPTGWTWDGFLQAALSARDAGAGVYGIGSIRGYLIEALLLIHQHGGRIMDESQTPARPAYDDPMTIEALEWLARLFHTHDVAVPAEQVRQAFGDNKIAMWMDMFSNREQWSGRMGDVLGVTVLPHDALAYTGSDCHAYAISSRTQHPDASWQWIAYLSEQMPHRLTPARRSLVDSAEYERLVGSDLAAVVRTSLESNVQPTPRTHAQFAAQMPLFSSALSKILDGAWTPREAMTWAQREAVRLAE